MSEEFKPIRITLSDEAFAQLNMIMKDASFRSYSSAIEECIRVVFGIIGDIEEMAGGKIGEVKGSPKDFSQKQAFHAFITITTRMARFTGWKASVKP